MTEKKLKKGDAIFYNASEVPGFPISGRVERVHRDGEVTVLARFNVDAEGKDIPGTWLGFTARTSVDKLFPTFDQLPKKNDTPAAVCDVCDQPLQEDSRIDLGGGEFCSATCAEKDAAMGFRRVVVAKKCEDHANA